MGTEYIGFRRHGSLRCLTSSLEIDPSLQEAVEEFPVEALVAQLVVAALNMSIFHELPGVM